MTIGEGNVVLRATNDQAEHDSQSRLAQAWYIAALSRTKHMPTLQRLLEPVHIATPEEEADSKAAYDELMAIASNDG
jgi:hypothetical protein